MMTPYQMATARGTKGAKPPPPKRTPPSKDWRFVPGCGMHLGMEKTSTTLVSFSSGFSNGFK